MIFTLSTVLVAFMQVSCQRAPEMQRSNREMGASKQPAPSTDVENDDDQPPSSPTTDLTGPASGSLRLTVTMGTPTIRGGRYGDNHVQAIWITDANDQYVKTLTANAATRAIHLRKWRAANGASLDGVSGPTLPSYSNQPTTITWDLTNMVGATVDKGNYKLWFEISERNTVDGQLDGTEGYNFLQIPFVLNKAGDSTSNNNSPVFANISLQHQ